MDKDNKLEYVFSRKLCKENLNKMYSSCIIFFIVFLIMGSMGFYAKGEVKSEILAIAVPIAMICFCIVGFLVSRQVILPEYKKYQEPYLSYHLALYNKNDNSYNFYDNMIKPAYKLLVESRNSIPQTELTFP